jgi:hypothetical protein
MRSCLRCRCSEAGGEHSVSRMSSEWCAVCSRSHAAAWSLMRADMAARGEEAFFRTVCPTVGNFLLYYGL